VADDSLGFLEAVDRLPEQLASGPRDQRHWRSDGPRSPSAGDIDQRRRGSHGGSGIAGDVLRAVGTCCPVPVIGLKQIRHPRGSSAPTRSRSAGVDPAVPRRPSR